MASPQAGADGGGAEQPGEAPLQTHGWRTWHTDSDMDMRRSLIQSMCVPRRPAAHARGAGGAVRGADPVGAQLAPRLAAPLAPPDLAL
jgi:hypothetical protein